jgi:hypothetical protein
MLKGMKKAVRIAKAAITCEAAEACAVPFNQNEPGAKLAQSSKAQQTSE